MLLCFDKHSLQWRHNGRGSVSNHQPHDCLLNHLFRRRSKKTSKLRVTGVCAGNSPETGEFPAQMASNAENVSIWWRHHVYAHFSWLQHWHWGNHTIAPMPVKQPWKMNIHIYIFIYTKRSSLCRVSLCGVIIESYAVPWWKGVMQQLIQLAGVLAVAALWINFRGYVGML